ncbi:ATP-binding cassette domain-containing protein [Kineococcus gynurae]|uniref:ATP-binding cassette domain-containing protein n=1 Tax=Kineococcus gynurae TaxID=452979 RepID=A0ABV5LPY8_9ACTN
MAPASAPSGATSVRVRGLRVRDGSRTYLGGSAGLDLDVGAGSRVLLVGPSGAGKSTLLRALAGLVEDLDGQNSGEVLLDGRPVRAGRAGSAGLLLQDPQETVVAASVGRDTAFGPENRGADRAEIWARVAEAHHRAQLRVGPGRDTVTLSGGERQRLGLAGVLALDPGLLLLDEPTSMLDAATARRVRDSVLAAVGPRTLVVVDHDLAAWAEAVDRVLVLDHDGVLVADGTPAAVLGDEVLATRLGLRVPGGAPPRPADVAGLHPAIALVEGEPALVAESVGLSVRSRGIRPSAPTLVLDAVDAQLRSGALTALGGPSGAGKSSLLGLLAGLQRPTRGRVLAAAGLTAGLRHREPARWRSRDLAARVGWMPQHPDRGFVRPTVAEEVRVTLDVLGRGPGEVERVVGLLEQAGLADRAGLDPRLLSGGEQRRLSAVCAVAAAPAVLLADEPTVGQDARTWAFVTGLLVSAAAAGATVVTATHDTDLLDLADEQVHLVDGHVDHRVAGRAPVRTGVGSR